MSEIERFMEELSLKLECKSSDLWRHAIYRQAQERLNEEIDDFLFGNEYNDEEE